MMRAGWSILLGLAFAACSSRDAGPPAVGDAPALAAVITREETVVRADGVTVSTRFRERMVRADGRVWVERVLDPRVHAAADEDGHAHHHHDWSTEPRLVSRSKDGGVALHFALLGDRELVEVPAPEFSSVGFTSSWEEVASLVPGEVLARLEPASRPGTPEGARWLEGSSNGAYLRVLWSDRLALALEVQSGREDGTVVRIARAQVEEGPVQKPWQGTEAFTQRDINDFRD